MKKKLLTLLLATALVCSFIGCGGSDESSKKEDKKTESSKPAKKDEEKQKTGKVDKIALDNKEGTLTYVKHEVTKDYDGKPAIMIYFDYTNKQDEASSAQMTFYPQAFQNGVECEMAMSLEDNEALQNTSKDIQKGTTINIAFIYSLQDTTKPVTLKVSDQSADNLLDDIEQEQELALQ